MFQVMPVPMLLKLVKLEIVNIKFNGVVEFGDGLVAVKLNEVVFRYVMEGWQFPLHDAPELMNWVSDGTPTKTLNVAGWGIVTVRVIV